MRRSALLVVALLGTVACGLGPSGDPPPPDASDWEPGKFDSAYDIEGLRDFYLIGNDLTPGQDALALTVRAPAEVESIEAWLDQGYLGRLRQEEGIFSLAVDVSELEAGEHRLILAADGSDDAFAALSFVRSHPLYVVVTNDWDDADNPDPTFTRQEQLHEWHPELRLTHFVGPYTFTDPSVTEERADFIVSWLLEMRQTYDDEVGLHIHPYCSFVESAGVPCRTEPSFARPYADRSGYTVFVSSYDEQEFSALLRAADEIFVERGLGKPTSFRAGGWTAEIHTLAALAANGYVADTSSMNWERLEEWRDHWGASLYSWNREHWWSIGETSQPYYPSVTDILASEAPRLPILEVPDNGLLVDYVTAEEMIEMFQANWSGDALDEPRQYSIGYHPPNFSEEYQGRIHDALTHVDQFLASEGNGPVVYASLSDLVLVWPPAEEQ